MAKRKKRHLARHPEEFQQLDEELSRALDNLAQRNKETEASLGEFRSDEADPEPSDDAQEAPGEDKKDETAQ
jgi:hypothetical protein